MIEPPRLHEYADGHVGEMIRAGKADGPRNADKRRLLSTLAALEGSSAAQAHAIPASSWSSRRMLAVLGLAVLGSFGAWTLSSNSRVAVVPEDVSTPAPSHFEPPWPPSKELTPAVPSVEVLALPSPSAVSVLPAASAARRVELGTKPTESAPVSTASPSTPADELAAVERIRAQLAGGDAAGARRDVAGYRATFARGRFVEEVDALEVEVLAAQGARATAKEKAADFLARYPSSPYVRRIRSVFVALEKAETP